MKAAFLKLFKLLPFALFDLIRQRRPITIGSSLRAAMAPGDGAFDIRVGESRVAVGRARRRSVRETGFWPGSSSKKNAPEAEHVVMRDMAEGQRTGGPMPLISK